MKDVARTPQFQTYPALTVALHWLTAVCLLAAVTLGLGADLFEDDEMSANILALHKSLGLVIFAIVLVRVVARLVTSAPPLPEDMNRAERFAAWAAHMALYAILILMPITGYIGVAARGRASTFFGMFDVPRIVPLDRVLSLTGQNIHDFSQYGLYALLIVHVGATAWHQVVRKDGILRRMWF